MVPDLTVDNFDIGTTLFTGRIGALTPNGEDETLSSMDSIAASRSLAVIRPRGLASYAAWAVFASTGCRRLTAGAQPQVSCVDLNDFR